MNYHYTLDVLILQSTNSKQVVNLLGLVKITKTDGISPEDNLKYLLFEVTFSLHTMWQSLS